MIPLGPGGAPSQPNFEMEKPRTQAPVPQENQPNFDSTQPQVEDTPEVSSTGAAIFDNLKANIDAAKGESEQTEPTVENIPKNTEEMSEEVELYANELENTEIGNATTTEGIYEAVENHANSSGEDPAQAKERLKEILQRMEDIAGQSVETFLKLNEGSNLKSFIDNWLVFNNKGTFGGSRSSEIMGSEQLSGDDEYLIKELQREGTGGKPPAIEFFQIVFNNQDLKVENLQEYIKRFNTMAAIGDKADMESKMSSFLNNKGESGEHSFTQIWGIMSRLQGSGKDTVYDFFKIEVAEEPKAESKEEAGDESTDDESTDGEGSSEKPPIELGKPYEEVPLSDAA